MRTFNPRFNNGRRAHDEFADFGTRPRALAEPKACHLAKRERREARRQIEAQFEEEQDQVLEPAIAN